MKTESTHAAKSERTLITALLFSAPGPAITLFAAISSGSATQLADFMRRTAELAASFVSWLMFHKLRGEKGADVSRKQRLEKIADRTVSGAMICSGAALFIVGTVRLFSLEVGGKSVAGLVIAALGLVFNVVFWLRYRKLAHEKHSPVLAAQQRLYRAKACVDLCVTIALAAVVIAPNHPASPYIDAIGSILVAIYLTFNGVTMLTKKE